MKVYYKLPDTDNDLESKMIGLLYENMKLRVLLAVQPVKVITDKEDGMILIERTADSIEIRYIGWKPDTELILKSCVAQIKELQKVHF